MRRLASRGALWLVWLCARGEPVAVLYGMEHAGKVSAYQTGRKPDLPEQLRPGAVLLALAMRQAVEAGLQEFDLQADEAPYKLQLAPQLRSLVQLRVARKSVVEGLRRAARSISSPKLPLGRPPVENVAISPNGELLAAIGFEEVLVWDLKKHRLIQAAEVQASSTTPNMPLAFSPDGQRLLYGHGPKLTVAEPATLRPVAELTLKFKHFQDAAFAPDGHSVATVSNEETVKTWDTATWAPGPEWAWQVGKLKCIAFAADGMRAACGSDKGRIVVWDLDL